MIRINSVMSQCIIYIPYVVFLLYAWENGVVVIIIITTISHVISGEECKERRNACKVNYYYSGKYMKSI